nr:leucine-rich repeat domain-containing protein [Prevotella sp.]
MKKKILLSMILLALCLIQASADNYYFRIRLYNDKNEPGEWSNYIYVSHDAKLGDWVNGLRVLAAGETVTDGKQEYTLPKKDEKVDLDKIWGIEFANGEGIDNNNESDIMQGGEYKAWEQIRSHIKYLRLRKYKLDTYNGDGYFAGMNNVEELELPEDGMTVGNGENDYNNMYFANADKLKKITIWNGDKAVDITDNTVTSKPLLNIVGQYMFSNCYSLSTKYINRLIKDVSEIKDNAFKADDGNRGKFSDEADNTVIEIPSSVTKIGDLAFWNRVKVTGLNIQGDGGRLDIGFEAFRGCDELAKITYNKELKIYKNAFRGCKQLNAFENMDKAKITYLGTGVFGDCRSMTNEFVNGVLQNYADNGEETKIPAYLFYGCNGQDGHDGKDANKNKCSFTDLVIPAKFSQIGDGAFASSGDAEIKLKTITVNREVAPECQLGETDEYAGITKKSVFEGLDPNMTTVIFANGAEGWEETEATGFLTYMNDGSEFQRLLTKDLFSDHEVYNNVPQQHAIVRLHRTLKKGWNTICLPFGVNYRYCSLWGEKYSEKQAYNTRIIVNGLTNNDSKADHNNFTMGVYRGYWREGKTFMFLHYTDFDKYPLDLGETFLVKMRQKDIDAANGVYTFRNVDLNYRWHADGKSGNEGNWTLKNKYTAEEMLGSVKEFDGRENTDATPFVGKANYDDYVLKGSLVQLTGTVGDSRITTDDYFFQQSKDGKMKLYPYKDSQKYGIRGFSGWFHHKTNNNNSKASELSLSLFDDSSITPIETVKVDDLNRDTSGKVYSISGVLMENNAADLNNLPKGIYVVNGKKYVVK